MKNSTYLAILLSITSVYLVGINLPAIAYLAIPMSILYITIKNKKIFIELNKLPFLLSILSLIVLIAVRSNFSDMSALAFIANLGMAALVFIVFSQGIGAENARRVIYWSIILHVLIATIDTIYKFIFPMKLDQELLIEKDFWDFGFYAFKGSLFYLDSNALAFLMLPVVYLLFKNESSGIKNYFPKYFKFYVLILFILTFSRAGYVAGIILTVSIIQNKYFRPVISGAAILGIYYLYTLFIDDQSLAFKFKEFNLIYDHLASSDFIQIIFGRGFGWGDKNFFFLQGSIAKTLIELGLLGFILYLLSFFSLLYKSGAKLFYIAFFVFSQSSNFYLFPAFAIGLLTLHKKIMDSNRLLKKPPSAALLATRPLLA